MMNLRFPRVSVLAGCLAASVSFGAPVAPDWMAAAARGPVAVATNDADAVVLLNETLVEVAKDGSRLNRVRRVVRVLNLDGKKYARASVNYLSDASTVKSFNAWLIKPAGGVVAYAKKHIVDLAVHVTALELYGEARQQQINATDDAAVGAVFGYESLVAEKTSSLQLPWRFREVLPVERSSFGFRLAEGWEADARIFNTQAVAANAAGRMRTWTMTAIPGIPAEPMSPPPLSFSPWMALNLLPPGKTREAKEFIPVGSWEEIARYFSGRYAAAAKWDDAMKRKADALVAGADSSWERIRRLARHAQQVNYISIQLDMSNAGGFIPRPAPRVFQCNYGDCKDKSTLLRALLASQGVQSFPLLVQVGEASQIQESWPSPIQFNHCILAVAVDDSVQAPAVIVHPRLGRMLLLDPTDENTPPGLLATPRLADKGLLLAGEDGSLIDLPETRKETEKLVRRVTATLDELGGLSGTIIDNYSGLASTGPRGEHSRLRAEDFTKLIERWLSGTLPAVKTTRLEPVDNFAAGSFILTVEFSTSSYGKMMRDKLLVFKPAVVSRRGANQLAKKPRVLPVLVRASAFQEITEITLPQGFEVDESPAPLEVKTEFGRYASSTTFENGKLRFERVLELRTTEIPAADYEQPRRFFERVLQGEQSPVVLRRTVAEKTPDPVPK